MKILIVDILNYSGLSAKTGKYETVDLNVLLNDVLVDVELIVQETNATIVAGDLPAILVNKGQMRQVFQNIISNSLKFVHPLHPPKINITTKRMSQKTIESSEQEDGPYVLISFRDNGIGLDEKYADNIFDLFQRLHSKDKYEGTGIGLAIAKKIIDKHHGVIGVKSREGEGSDFMIVLPVRQQVK